jgi:hypothetical protein
MFDTEQNSSKFLLEIMTPVSSAMGLLFKYLYQEQGHLYKWHVQACRIIVKLSQVYVLDSHTHSTSFMNFIYSYMFWLTELKRVVGNKLI